MRLEQDEKTRLAVRALFDKEFGAHDGRVHAGPGLAQVVRHHRALHAASMIIQKTQSVQADHGIRQRRQSPAPLQIEVLQTVQIAQRVGQGVDARVHQVQVSQEEETAKRRGETPQRFAPRQIQKTEVGQVAERMRKQDEARSGQVDADQRAQAHNLAGQRGQARTVSQHQLVQVFQIAEGGRELHDGHALERELAQVGHAPERRGQDAGSVAVAQHQVPPLRHIIARHPQFSVPLLVETPSFMSDLFTNYDSTDGNNGSRQQEHGIV